MPFNRACPWNLHTPDNPPLECRVTFCKEPPLPSVNLCVSHRLQELVRLITRCRRSGTRYKSFYDGAIALYNAFPHTTTARRSYNSPEELIRDIMEGLIDGSIDTLSLPEKLDRLVPRPKRGRPSKTIRLPSHSPTDDRAAND